MDITLADLWLPIAFSAVAVWIASFFAWAVLPHHKADWKGAPNEDVLLDTIRNNNIPPGQYMFPHCADYSEMKDPEKKKRWEAGPHGTLNVWPGVPGMGGNMIKSVIYYIVVGLFVAYLATMTSIPKGAEFMDVFRFAGTAAVAMYALGNIPQAIWFRKPLRSSVTDLADNIVYGIITGVLFAVMWPAVEAVTNGSG